MNYLFVFIGLNVHFIFLFKREILLNKRSYLVLLLGNFILFMLAYFLDYNYIGDTKFNAMLKVGFLSQLIFKALHIVFVKLFKKDPEDTFWSMDKTLMKDGLFNMTFWILGAIIPIFLATSHTI